VHLDEGGMFATGAALEEARARGAEALALSRRTGDPAAIADALLALAMLEAGERLPQSRRAALAEEALGLAREAGDARLIAFALMSRANALPPDQGQSELEQAARAMRAFGATRSLIWLYSDAAYGALKNAQPELARPLLDQARARACEAGNPGQLASVCGNTGLEALFTAISSARAWRFMNSFNCLGSTSFPWRSGRAWLGSPRLQAAVAIPSTARGCSAPDAPTAWAPTRMSWHSSRSSSSAPPARPTAKSGGRRRRSRAPG
jgi:hypothetical protein